MKVHILDDCFDTLRQLPCFQKLAVQEVKIWTDHCEDIDELAIRLADAEALVLFRERTKISRDLLERLPKLRLISQRSVYPHIDVQACTDHDILLCSRMPTDNTPNYAAAELTWGLILSAARQLPQQMASTKAGHWQMGVGKTLRGRTLGLYGYGRIAGAVAEYARAFGMQVQWWSSEEGRARAAAAGETIATSRANFFASSDFVSVHLRLKPETKHCITAEDLAQMKPDATFINTSRAGLIEAHALLHALNTGKPGNAAIDVFDQEPQSNPQDPLLCHPNLIATPHIGFVTEDEFEVQFADIFDQVVAYATGSPEHMINPDVWPNN